MSGLSIRVRLKRAYLFNLILPCDPSQSRFGCISIALGLGVLYQLHLRLPGTVRSLCLRHEAFISFSASCSLFFSNDLCELLCYMCAHLKSCVMMLSFLYLSIWSHSHFPVHSPARTRCIYCSCYANRYASYTCYLECNNLVYCKFSHNSRILRNAFHCAYWAACRAGKFCGSVVGALFHMVTSDAGILMGRAVCALYRFPMLPSPALRSLPHTFVLRPLFCFSHFFATLVRLLPSFLFLDHHFPPSFHFRFGFIPTEKHEAKKTQT